MTWTHIVAAGVTGEGRPRPVDHPAPTVTTKGTAYLLRGAEVWRRPGWTPQDAVRLSAEQVAQVQSFPADHPWQGDRGAQHRQIGNAVPPALAEAVLRALVFPSDTN